MLNLEKFELSWTEDSSVPIGWSLRFLRQLRSLRLLRLLRTLLCILRWVETPHHC